MQLIPFTEDDLAANDDGFFTEAQKKLLKPKTDLFIALSVIGAFMGFVIAVILFYVGQNTSGFFFPTAFSLIVFGICFYGVFWSLAIANKIKRGYGVKKVEGFADLWIEYSGKDNEIPVYLLRIQGVRFRLNEKTYDAFAEGEYRVYYFRLLQNELLSVEPAD